LLTYLSRKICQLSACRDSNNNRGDSPRRVFVREGLFNNYAFRDIITAHGSQLEELVMHTHVHYQALDHDWQLVTDKCRFLRILDIVDRGPPPTSFINLIASLPDLQVLSMHFAWIGAQYQALLLSVFLANFEQHRVQYGTRHPLKSLEFSAGRLDCPDVALMDILATHFSQIESVRVYCGQRPRRPTPLCLSTPLTTVASSSSSSTWGAPDTTGQDLRNTLI
jgi:hypothetical protein